MSEMHERIRARYHEIYAGPLVLNDWAGVEYIRSSPESAIVRLPFGAHLADAQGVIGPAVIAFLIDAVAGQVGVPATGWAAQIVSISLQASFTAAVPAGAGLVGEGRLAMREGTRSLAEIAIRADSIEAPMLALGRVRMTDVGRARTAAEAEAWPLAPFRRDRPFLGPEDMAVSGDAAGVRAVLPPREHYMGNVTRRALHGGIVAGALFETAARLGAMSDPAFRLLDGQVDFLRPTHDREIVVEAAPRLVGRRVTFAEAVLTQAAEGQEAQQIALLRATLGR